VAVSTRERATLLLGILGALLLVLYPLAYRLTTEQADSAAAIAPTTRNALTVPTIAPVVTEPPIATPTDPPGALLELSWHADATKYRGANGGHFTFDCLPGGSLNPVWGTDVYTDDSSVCTAAVHAGLITLDQGGIVVIEIRRGQDAYVGTTRNGVRTSGYEQWDGSFEFYTD
jgi:LCCL domain-containing protein